MEEREGYYTPGIEEFHVGFEYEEFHSTIKDKTRKWYPKTYQDCMYADYDGCSCFEEVKVRVKYLDRGDIESLGFKLWNKDEYEGDERLWYEKEVDGTCWRMVHIPNRHYVACSESIEFDEGGFSLTVKNKSELIKLLKQLGI